VDLNCDLGESFGRWELGEDAAVLPYVTSANVACGFHAGDPRTMVRTVRLAKAHGVAVGAHPGFRDLVGFGRRRLEATPDEIYADVLYQIGALGAVCRAEGVPLSHVKAHGALYNAALTDFDIAEAVVRAVRAYDPALVVVSAAGAMLEAARALGLPTALEGFVDRAYHADGRLVARSRPDAVIADPAVAAARAVRLAREGRIATVDGGWLTLQPATLCIHGDTPGAARLAEAVRAALEAAGIPVAPLARP
jgi:UPF0271 protein